MTRSSPDTDWSSWREWSRTCVAAGMDLVWPRCCLMCDVRIVGDDDSVCLCPACRQAVYHDPETVCPRCASAVGPYTDTTKNCVRCRKSRLSFGSTTRLGPYTGLLRDAVLRMKHAAGEPLAETIGLAWARVRRDALLRHNPDAIVPIPLHWRRRWARGYNQSEAIAGGLASVLGRPCLTRVVRRVRATPSQQAQTAAERRDNVRSAFRCHRPERVRNLRILLVDDVVTTGATASAAADALLAAGAAEVRLAVLAHR